MIPTAAALVPESWHIDEEATGSLTIWEEDERPLLFRLDAPEAFDVLAALIHAAQAERGETR